MWSLGTSNSVRWNHRLHHKLPRTPGTSNSIALGLWDSAQTTEGRETSNYYWRMWNLAYATSKSYVVKLRGTETGLRTCGTRLQRLYLGHQTSLDTRNYRYLSLDTRNYRYLSLDTRNYRRLSLENKFWLLNIRSTVNLEPKSRSFESSFKFQTCNQSDL